MLFFLAFTVFWLALHHAVRVGVKEDGSQILGTLSANSSRAKVQPKEAVGSLRPGMFIDEFELVERLKQWSLETKTNNLMQQNGSMNVSTSILQKVEAPYLEDFEDNRKLLDHGSFGETWKVRPRDPSRFFKRTELVLKLFFTVNNKGQKKYHSYQGAPQGVQRSMREEDEACKITHELIKRAAANNNNVWVNICPCLGSYVIGPNGEWVNMMGFILQDFCGLPLSALVQDVSRTSEMKRRHARDVTRQLLSVISWLGQGLYPRIILHHDLKPANILYIPSGDTVSIRVIDWGGLIDIQANDLTPFYTCASTPLYTPPESLAGGPCYPPSRPQSFDVYAVGLIFVELMLSGWNDWFRNSNKIDDTMIMRMKRRANDLRLQFTPDDEMLILSLCEIDPLVRISPTRAMQLVPPDLPLIAPGPRNGGDRPAPIRPAQPKLLAVVSPYEHIPFVD